MKLSFLVQLVAACMLFTGCSSLFKPPRPMTFEEQQAYMAKQQCIQSATDMNPEWPSSSNPLWNSYFVMCMHNFGISDATLQRMWY